jgi:hypothetical protein
VGARAAVVADIAGAIMVSPFLHGTVRRTWSSMNSGKRRDEGWAE